MKTSILALLALTSISAQAVELDPMPTVHLNAVHEIFRTDTGWKVLPTPNKTPGAIVMEKEIIFPDTMYAIKSWGFNPGTPSTRTVELAQLINIDNPGKEQIFWQFQSNGTDLNYEHKFEDPGLHTMHKWLVRIHCVPPTRERTCFGYVDFTGPGTLQK